MVQCIDERCRKHSQACEDLTQSSEVEESSLGHGEQLAQEHQKGDRGENHREDHKDLHRLKPLSFFGGRTQPCFCEVVKPAVVPQV